MQNLGKLVVLLGLGDRVISRFFRAGEHFTEEELAEYLTTLLGFNPEGGRVECGSYDPTGAELQTPLAKRDPLRFVGAQSDSTPLQGSPGLNSRNGACPIRVVNYPHGRPDFMTFIHDGH